MKCNIPAEVGAHIFCVAQAELRAWIGEVGAGGDGECDQGLEGHKEAGDTDHVIVEAGEAVYDAADRSDNTDTRSHPSQLGSAHWKASWTVITLEMMHCGRSL